MEIYTYALAGLLLRIMCVCLCVQDVVVQLGKLVVRRPATINYKNQTAGHKNRY